MRPLVKPMSVIAWETTKQCPLRCKHCRADADASLHHDELSTDEGKKLIDGIAHAYENALLILSGGEPMARPDIYELAEYAHEQKLRVVMSPCGPSITPESVVKMKAAHISALSISIDGKDAQTHDAFRGIPGIYDKTLVGISHARVNGMPFQINCTVTKFNMFQIPEMIQQAVILGAMALDLFFLVPTGRGKALEPFALSAEECETILSHLVEFQRVAPIPIRVTCAPQWVRVADQNGFQTQGHGGSRGCLAGRGFLFVSHKGRVQPCGFLQLNCGELRSNDFNLSEILNQSDVLQRLQKPQNYHGTCAHCPYGTRCGGCRARAYEATGDYLDDEPYCIFSQQQQKKLLNVLQEGLPLEKDAVTLLAQRVNRSADDCVRFVSARREQKLIRRFGAIFDSASLGYRSLLVTVDAPESMSDVLAAKIQNYPQITHSYARRGKPAFWFTFTARETHFDAEFQLIKEALAPYDVYPLPALEKYKVQVLFDFGLSRPATTMVPTLSPKIPLTATMKRIVRLMQVDTEFRVDYFEALSEKLSISVEELCTTLQSMKDCGMLRRIGAILYHRAAGVTHNAMAVWDVPASDASRYGSILAQSPAVTHCYFRRVPSHLIPGGLFAMVHASTAESMTDTLSQLCAHANLPQPHLYFSQKEYKKASPLFFMEDVK